jgi:hypothetical protein
MCARICSWSVYDDGHGLLEIWWISSFVLGHIRIAINPSGSLRCISPNNAFTGDHDLKLLKLFTGIKSNVCGCRLLSQASVFLHHQTGLISYFNRQTTNGVLNVLLNTWLSIIPSSCGILITSLYYKFIDLSRHNLMFNTAFSNLV